MSLQGYCGVKFPLPSKWLSLVLGLCAGLGSASLLHAQVMQADPTGAAGGAVEMPSYTSSGSYFNRELGTPLRFGYHSEGYGTETGVVSLGTMKVFNLDGATWFLDGQGTMSDDFGGGFNLGIGYRELVNMSHGLDPDRIMGASFWTDGQSTKADNFFTQLGFGLESLGESFDLRMNGYFPLDRVKTGDPELIDIDTIRFGEHGLFGGSQIITTDTAYSVLDAEAARRIGNLDAWAVAAVYHLGGGDEAEDATGYRIGVRGYAVPDLLVGVEVTDDDIYHTNVMARITWFVGRTHRGNAPIGAIVDRFREPVMRNSYISTVSSTTETAAFELRDADTNDFFNFLHVDANAAPNGDGTFENPFNNLAAAEGAQAEGAYVYMHSGSEFNPAADFQLLDNVKFWGEGTNQFGDVVQHAVDTVERGSVFLPETSAGAQAELAPIINGFGLVLADNNDVNNATFNGGTNIIVGDGVNAPQLANLDINGPTGIGISLTNLTGTAVVENTVTIDDANTGMLIHGGNSGMNVNAQITNSIGSSLIIEDRTGGTIAYGGSIQDDNTVAATAEGIIIRNNTGNTTVNFTQLLDPAEDLGININSGDFHALLIDNNSATTAIRFDDLFATAADADTVLFNGGGTLTINDSDDESLIQNTGTGDAFHYSGGAATISVAANVANLGGGSAVHIQNHTENNVTFSGEITDTAVIGSTGIVLTGNTGGTIAFNDRVSITGTGTGNGVAISGGGADVTYTFTDIGINVQDGTAFSATGDGTLVVTSAEGENDIQTATGTAININGLAIGEGGANFDTVNVINGAGTGIVLTNIDGTGVLTIGSGEDRGDGGTLSTAGTAISVHNVDNLAVSNVTVDNSSTAGAGLIVTGQNGGNAAFDQLTVTTSGAAAAANVNGNTGGTTNFVNLEATSADGDAIVLNNNNGHTVNINGMTATATGSGRGFAATNQGTLSVTGNTEVNSATGIGVELDNVTVAASGAEFQKVNVSNAATNGVRLHSLTAGGPVRIGSGTNPGDGGTITSTGDAILVDNADNVAITRVTVDNDVAGNTGNGLVIQNQNNGNVSVTGLTAKTRDGAGIVAQNNTGGINVYNNTTINATGAGNGVTLNSNTGASHAFTTLAINATTGTGFAASGGGTVTATGTNTVTTTTGTGVNMNGMEIGAAGFNLNSVNVSGATNGVVLTNLNGPGTFRQGAATATGLAGNGGTLSTTGDAIVLSGVTNAVFNDVTANSSTGRAALVTHTVTTPATIIFDNFTSTGVVGSGVGMEVVDSGTGELDFTLRNSSIEMDLADTNAFLFTAGNNGGRVDVRLENNTLTTEDATAVRANVASGTGNVQFLVTNNTVNNNSASAAANFTVQANRTLNLTVGGQGSDPADGNSFSNGTGLSFAATTTGGASRINLDLQNNTANNPGAVQYELTITNGQFGVVDRDDTFDDLNNAGNVQPGAGNVVGDFINLTGPIDQVN